MGYFDDLLPNTQAPQTYIRQGASVISPAKQATATVGTAYRSLLVPTDFLQVSTQGATPEQILINAWGACGTATGESLTVAGPYLGSQSFDSLGLAIPSAPQAGDSIRVTRFSRTSTRAITHKIAKQKQQPFLQDMRPLDGIIIKHYGTYSFVDANGVTHQPPGKRDPVVQLPGVGANIDNDTIKFDANGRMYADLFSQGAADGSGASVATVAGLKAGHGIELIPGFIPTESPTVVVEAGGSVPAGSYAYMYVWLYGTVRTPQSPSVSCTTVDGPPTDYHQPHLTIPGKDDINHATGIELYRKDATVGANGTIQTKFAYTSSPGVLIADPSTGATVITTGAYTGMYQYTVLSTHTGVDAGDEFEYNPLVRVKAGDPPIPYDPRDGSLTTLIESGANDGSSIFKTSDGGAFNQLTGAVTYPQDNPLNHSGYRLVDTLTPQHDPQDYIDTKTDAMLGALYVKQATSINVKPARYTVEPYPGMAPISGTNPSLWELSGVGFNSSDPLFGNDGLYARTHFGLGINEQNDITPKLAAFASIPAVGTGGQTAVSIDCYGGTMYPGSSIGLDGGDDALGMYTKIDGVSIKRNANDEMYVASGGGGFAPASLRVESSISSTFSDGATETLQWATTDQNIGGFTVSSANITIPATGEYEYSFVSGNFGHGSNTPFGAAEFALNINGGWDSRFDYRTQCQDSTVPLNILGTMVAAFGFSAIAGDVITITILNNTAQTLSVGRSYLMINRVA